MKNWTLHWRHRRLGQACNHKRPILQSTAFRGNVIVHLLTLPFPFLVPASGSEKRKMPCERGLQTTRTEKGVMEVRKDVRGLLEDQLRMTTAVWIENVVGTSSRRPRQQTFLEKATNTSRSNCPQWSFERPVDH